MHACIYIFICIYIYIILVLLNIDLQPRNLDLHFYFKKNSTNLTGRLTEIRSSGSSPHFELYIKIFVIMCPEDYVQFLPLGIWKCIMSPCIALDSWKEVAWNATQAKTSKGANSEREHSCDKRAPKLNEITKTSKSKLNPSGQEWNKDINVRFFFLLFTNPSRLSRLKIFFYL